MPGNSAVKSTASVALKRFWPQAVAACMCFVAVLFLLIYVCLFNETLLPTYASVINIPLSAISFIAVIMPLVLGMLRYFYKATAGNIDSVVTVFFFFSSGRYLKSVFFSIMLGIKLLTVAAITFLPYILTRLSVLMQFKLFGENFMFYAELLGVIFEILGILFFVLATAKYYIAPMIYACREDMNWTEVFYLAKHVSRFSSGAFLILLLGFFGWGVLSLFAIPALFTVPYFLSAYCVHCRYAFFHYNHRIDVMKETEFPEYRSSF